MCAALAFMKPRSVIVRFSMNETNGQETSAACLQEKRTSHAESVPTTAGLGFLSRSETFPFSTFPTTRRDHKLHCV